LDYKIEYTCHHVAKFHVDRPMKSRGEKKTSAVKHKP